MPTKPKGRKTSSARSPANASKVPPKDPGGEVVFYRSPDGVVRLEVPLAQETVWLTQQQMAALFQRERFVITKHINNVFKEGELDLKATCAKFAQVQSEGGRTVKRHVDHTGGHDLDDRRKSPGGKGGVSAYRHASSSQGRARMITDTTERGLERLICTALTGHPCDPPKSGEKGHERPATYGVGWIGGIPEDYDREYCVDLAQLGDFLRETQPEAAEALDLGQEGPTRRKFLARLQGEITKRGSIDVLRHGIKHGAHHLDLFYGTPSPGNEKARKRYAANRFSVTR